MRSRTNCCSRRPFALADEVVIGIRGQRTNVWVSFGQHTFLDAIQGFCVRLFPSYMSFHEKQPQLARAVLVAAVFAAALAAFTAVLCNIFLLMYFSGVPIFQFFQDGFD